MNHRYQHLLSPIKIGNVILKNRMLATKIISQQLQGPEIYPAEATVKFVTDLAKNGASIVTCSMGDWRGADGKYPFMTQFHMDDSKVCQYFSRMVDRIHAYGTLASAAMQNSIPKDVQISDVKDWSKVTFRGDYGGHRKYGEARAITKDEIHAFQDEFVRRCVYLKNQGFDMINVYMYGRGGLLANSLSPSLNQREDEYGGSPENRARLTLELFRMVKDACGKDFLIEMQTSAVEEPPFGYTTDEFYDYAKMCEGLVDIIQIRGWDGSSTHVGPFNMIENEPPYNLRFAEGFKKRNIDIVVAPNGGFQNPDAMEQYLAEGKCDMVALGRAFICDPEFGKKVYEGRGEDIVPCIRCDACHGGICSVNPMNGLSHVQSDMFDAPKATEKVAVIGGGPAGMEAALTAAKRGHQVTLFEKNDRLGGQLLHADHVKFKWLLRDYKDYMIQQLGKNGVDVHLSTEATPERLKAGGYDAIIAACGSTSKMDIVPGASTETCIDPLTVFGNEETLGEHVVVVGGGRIGYETGIHLAQKGKRVTLLTRRKTLEGGNGHSIRAFNDLVESVSDRMTPVFQVTTTAIAKNRVTYQAQDGSERTIDCDAVILCGGREPATEECFRFAGIAPKFFVVGDSNIHVNRIDEFPDPWATKAVNKDGDVRHAVFTGYTAAASI